MEASEKPQLPLEIDADEGSVRLVGDRIVVERMEIADEGTARILRERFRDGEEPTRTIRRAIEIGTRVLDREDTAVEVDYVKRQFEQVTNEHRESVQEKNEEVVQQLDEAMRRVVGDESSNGALGDALDAQSEGFAERLAEIFGEGRDSAVQAQIRKMLEERDEKFMRRLSTEDDDNPLAPVLAAVRTWTRERKDDQDERDTKLETKLDEVLAKAAELSGLDQGRQALEEAEEAGTRKGRSFEERVHAAIERLAGSRGDCAHAVGDVAGTAGSKKGDSLVEIGAGEGAAQGRIVFEVKDSQLGKPTAWAEMNGALEARNADYALLVVAGDDAIPTGGVEEMHEYQGNKLIVAVDPDEPDGRALELAYRYASLRVRAVREAAAGVDATVVRTAASEARDAVAGFKTVKSALTSATKQVARASSGVEEIELAVIDRLDTIEAAIEDAVEDAEPGDED
jgi:hypothetical protein